MKEEKKKGKKGGEKNRFLRLSYFIFLKQFRIYIVSRIKRRKKISSSGWACSGESSGGARARSECRREKKKKGSSSSFSKWKKPLLPFLLFNRLSLSLSPSKHELPRPALSWPHGAQVRVEQPASTFLD